LLTSFDPIFVPDEKGAHMRTTLALDDDLLEKAQAFTGLKEKSALVREALRALIERESARRLALLGGSEPLLEIPPRRQSDAA
jgi:Arc/MetJ family transcription regulator